MLQKVLSDARPTFAFLSEPQLFQCDADQILQYVKGEYCWQLNSDDLLDPELPLNKSRSNGGTLLLWLKDLDPYIEVVCPTSKAFLPIILKMPDLKVSIHVSIYLPTHGKDTEFVSDLVDLRVCLDGLIERFTDPIIFIRGDSNVNDNNHTRVTLLQQLISDYQLQDTKLDHPTYHHFVGNGHYDSRIDKLMHSIFDNVTESVTNIMCIHDHPDMLSHHDIILSTFTIPTQHQPPSNPTHLLVAPRVDHTRTKIVWSLEGQEEYSQLVGPYLRHVREQWLDANNQNSMSVLLSLTNNILSRCAAVTNKPIVLGTPPSPKSRKTPKIIRIANNKMSKAHKNFKTPAQTKNKVASRAKYAFIATKKNYRQAVRKHRLKDSLERYHKLDDIFVNPTAAFKYLKTCRRSKQTRIEELLVGDKLYTGSAVCDGFYDSMTSLKQCDLEELRNDPYLSDQFTNYDIIVKISQGQPPIPPISLTKSTTILKSLKKDVKDYYSITALHYLNAGHEGLLHYNCLLNAIISNVNNANIEELNVAHGNILHKGHNKIKTSSRSYRTISTCPFLAKSADAYLRDLYLDKWDNQQAATQYQGSGSSHELASLLVTEAIQYSLHTANRPIFLLAIDAESAFDRCLRQVLCSELYKAEVPGSAILFIDNRLASRKTVYEWDGTKMGPAQDTTGFEQGGMNSSDFYKLNNNEQLKTAQDTELGFDIGSSTVSAVGEADDVIEMSNDLDNLLLLIKLTEIYCKRFRVKLEPKKTKLLCYSNKNCDFLARHAISTTRITINDVPVIPTNEAEHVGVVRNTAGNMPNIVHRITKHKKSLGSILSAGLARGHRGSPAAALHVHQIFCTPVLFSGLATLMLNKLEIRVIDSHYQNTIQNLQRLHSKTPRSIVYFLAGSLPGEAHLHLRQLSLFSMICHLPDDPLYHHAKYVLTTLGPSCQSWFYQIKDLCMQYRLDHPLLLLDKPVAKNTFKKLVKLNVTEYWQEVLATEAFSMQSLRYFDPLKSSLQQPHPMWTSTAGNSYECSKSTILARMVSGRYRTEMMTRFWSDNRNGFCLAETCSKAQGDLEHLLVNCPALEHVRHRLHGLWCLKTMNFPPLHRLILKKLGSSPTSLVKFILDSTSCPELIHLVQEFGQQVLDTVLYLTRTWAFCLHRQKLLLLGRWPTITTRKPANKTDNLPTKQPTNKQRDTDTNITNKLFNIISLSASSTARSREMNPSVSSQEARSKVMCSLAKPALAPATTSPTYYADHCPEFVPRPDLRNNITQHSGELLRECVGSSVLGGGGVQMLPDGECCSIGSGRWQSVTSSQSPNVSLNSCQNSAGSIA